MRIQNITDLKFKTDLPDCEQYFSLFESTGWNAEYKLSKEELYSTLIESYFTISAYNAGKLIGFGRVMSDGILHAMIYEMIIYPEYQEKGIGREILNLLVKECLDNNIRDIQLFCAKGKRTFYEKNGFVARPDDGPGMDYKK